MGKTEKLKPCPFCGGELELHPTVIKGDKCDWYVECTSCEFMLDEFITEEKAIEFINNRFDPCPDTEADGIVFCGRCGQRKQS